MPYFLVAYGLRLRSGLHWPDMNIFMLWEETGFPLSFERLELEYLVRVDFLSFCFFLVSG